MWALSASILAPWGTMLAPRDHPGGPWEQQGAHEMIRNMISMDFVKKSEVILKVFLGIEA